MKIVILLCFLGVSMVDFGQSFDYGVKAGANLNYVERKYSPEPKWKNFSDIYSAYVGFHAGAFMEVPLGGGRFFYRQEIEFIQKGYVRDAITQVNLPQDKYTLSYLQLPVAFGYKISSRFFVELGPSFAFQLSRKTDPGYDNADELNVPFEVSAMGGLRYKLFSRLDIQALYVLGMSNLVGKDFREFTFQDPDSGQVVVSDLSVKTRVVSLSIVYYLKRSE